MGQLIDGKWNTENVLVQHDDKGLYFKRDSVFRGRISGDAQSEFAAEPGRYHLYCAVACPWAHRATLVRTLKRLEPFVTLTNTFQESGGQGWSFGEGGHVVPGTDRRVRWLHELLYDRRAGLHDPCDCSHAVGRENAPRGQQRVF